MTRWSWSLTTHRHSTCLSSFVDYGGEQESVAATVLAPVGLYAGTCLSGWMVQCLSRKGLKLSTNSTTSP